MWGLLPGEGGFGRSGAGNGARGRGNRGKEWGIGRDVESGGHRPQRNGRPDRGTTQHDPRNVQYDRKSKWCATMGRESRGTLGEDGSKSTTRSHCRDGLADCRGHRQDHDVMGECSDNGDAVRKRGAREFARRSDRTEATMASSEGAGSSECGRVGFGSGRRGR